MNFSVNPSAVTSFTSESTSQHGAAQLLPKQIHSPKQIAENIKLHIIVLGSNFDVSDLV